MFRGVKEELSEKDAPTELKTLCDYSKRFDLLSKRLARKKQDAYMFDVIVKNFKNDLGKDRS